ncbi:TPA: aldo/keto reductase [Candidatus Poribacteria bacterium]|nr:aldo/keto reductase [Candidatus Poribacteria bacterium]
MSDKISRREFIKQASAVTAIALSGIHSLKALDNNDIDKIPKRVLGRTGVKVSTLGLGMGPLGITRDNQKQVEKLVNLCIDMGITYIDVAPNYGDGEQKLGPIIKQRRKEIFLVTKVEEPSKDGALRQVNESLKKMQTDQIDAVHLHDFGGMDSDVVLGKDGALAGLIEAQKLGLIKFIGVSGHQRPAKFLSALETDKIDLIMPVLNFADRYTYNFEEKVLPTAISHKSGIVAMKVLGGAVNMQYDKPMPALLPEEYHNLAIRYSLSLPGVSAVIIGLKNEDEIKKAVNIVKNYKPLTDEEKLKIDDVGKQLSKQWGAHFGSVE